MKKIFKFLPVAAFAFASLSAQAGDNVRVIEFHTEKIGDVVHWMPEKVSVNPGEKVKFVLKHELTGGFDFHGFTIRELDIVKQVDRNKTLEFEKEIPAALKAGEYKVSCQFHPKHMAAAMLVVTDKGAVAGAPAAAPKARMAPSAHSEHEGHEMATAPVKKSAPAVTEKK